MMVTKNRLLARNASDLIPNTISEQSERNEEIKIARSIKRQANVERKKSSGMIDFSSLDSFKEEP